MNEQEKALWQEFLVWLPKNVKKFANMSPKDIEITLSKLYESEQGKAEITDYFNVFKGTKQNGVQMAKHGNKIDYLVNKFYTGGPVEKDTVKVHNKMYLTPMWVSVASAEGIDVPRKYANQDPRQFKYIKSDFANKRYGIIQNKRTGAFTKFELDSNNEPINSNFGGKTYGPGDEIFDDHVRNYKHYTRNIVIPSNQNGGKIDLSKYLNIDLHKK